MSHKIKFSVWIFVCALCLQLMGTIDLIGTPGDYILSALGLPTWSNGDTGFHLIILYVMLPFAISVGMIGRYRRKVNFGRVHTFVLFVIVSYLLNHSILAGAEYIKGQSDGLLSVGFDHANSSYRIRTRDQEVEFDFEIKMTNYSDSFKTFSITIDNEFWREEGEKQFDFLDSNNEKAMFTLYPNETDTLVITDFDYTLSDENLYKGSSGSMSRGTIDELILRDESGNVIKLDTTNFFGTKITE